MDTYSAYINRDSNFIAFEIHMKRRAFYHQHGFYPSNVVLSYSDYLILQCGLENITCTDKMTTVFGLTIHTVIYKAEIYVF